MLYHEPKDSAISQRRSQSKLLGVPRSHLTVAALGVGLLNMIANDPAQLSTALFGMAVAVVHTQFKKIKRQKLSSAKESAS